MTTMDPNVVAMLFHALAYAQKGPAVIRIAAADLDGLSEFNVVVCNDQVWKLVRAAVTSAGLQFRDAKTGELVT